MSGKPCAQIGYGRTGHILGDSFILDTNRRGSYGHVGQKSELRQFIRTTTTEFSTISQHVEDVPGHNFKVRPFNEKNEAYKVPDGIARSGDSGGGCFNEEKKIVAVISGESRIMEEELAEESFLEIIDRAYVDQLPSVQDLSREIQKKWPEFIPPEIKNTEDILPHFAPKQEPRSSLFEAHTEMTALLPHREWIAETLRTL